MPTWAGIAFIIDVYLRTIVGYGESRCTRHDDHNRISAIHEHGSHSYWCVEDEIILGPVMVEASLVKPGSAGELRTAVIAAMRRDLWLDIVVRRQTEVPRPWDEALRVWISETEWPTQGPWQLIVHGRASKKNVTIRLDMTTPRVDITTIG